MSTRIKDSRGFPARLWCVLTSLTQVIEYVTRDTTPALTTPRPARGVFMYEEQHVRSSQPHPEARYDDTPDSSLLEVLPPRIAYVRSNYESVRGSIPNSAGPRRDATRRA